MLFYACCLCIKTSFSSNSPDISSQRNADDGSPLRGCSRFEQIARDLKAGEFDSYSCIVKMTRQASALFVKRILLRRCRDNSDNFWWGDRYEN